jgi:hypothetical protein
MVCDRCGLQGLDNTILGSRIANLTRSTSYLHTIPHWHAGHGRASPTVVERMLEDPSTRRAPAATDGHDPSQDTHAVDPNPTGRATTNKRAHSSSAWLLLASTPLVVLVTD